MHKFGDEELGQAAGRIWAQGRANPIHWDIRTRLGVFTTDDRATWRTASGDCTAELRRSRNGNHWFLALSMEVSTAVATTQVAGALRPIASACGSCARTSSRWQKPAGCYWWV